ncbi:hypothetical protein BH20ACT2_BH20ACT2_14050 [soil metagenome]
MVTDELLGHQVDAVAGARYHEAELIDGLGAAGFRNEDVRQRGPPAV